MTLVVDIGNTLIKFGVYDHDKNLKFVSRLATQSTFTEDELAVWISQFLALWDVERSEITGGIVSSVVPTLASHISKAVNRLCGHTCLILGPGLKTGLNIKIDNPAQLGSDMAAAAVAGASKYGSPLIIFGLGTATTISVIDEAGSFRGGALAPGVGISLSALSEKTAQLPYISIESPANPIGTNTVDCMKSGVVFGTAAMLDGMAERIEASLGYPAKLIATGGYAADIVRHCKHEFILDDHLILDGLMILYEKNK